MKRLAILVAAALVLPACAEMSGAQKGAAIGAGTGAVAGAIIGNQVKGNRSGHAGTGAIIGALGGAAAGALIGDAMEPKRPAAQGGPLQPVPPPGQPGAVPPPSQASVTIPGQYAGDPTRGQFVNNTPYQLKVYVDVDPARESSAPYLTMNPNDVLPANLDIGPHRVVAIASRDTQFGPRTVGQYDRQLRVDVRGSGWELRFKDGDFH